jgi:L,D-transpeptidase ErfK/SrfK
VGKGTFAVAALAIGLAGCNGVHMPLLSPKPPEWTEAVFAKKSIPSFTVRTEKGVPVETVIGEPRTYRIREGDTLIDVARFHDLGYDEIVEANPGVDPWVPPVGKEIVLPTAWVLPCCTYEGLVLNIPEMRLFYYQPTPGGLVVRTYPVGLGRTDRHTPRGKFRVTTKTVNPRWNIPESIREEHIRERGDDRASIAGGAPDNPLGKYRIGLSIPKYSIHGTDIPWGTGMLVSHGCTRLYPEDIERLFPLVAVNTPVEFVYQTVKVGTKHDVVYVEAHRDIYKVGGSPVGDALAELRRRGFAPNVDRKSVKTAVEASHGMPFRVGDSRRAAAS